MKFRTVGMLLVLIVLAVFLIINWGALSQVTTVNLVYTEIQAPLGVLVVGGFGIVVLLLAVYTVWQQASMMMELRAAYKEARTARQVAEDADKSRVAEIRTEFAARLEKLETLLTDRTDELLQTTRDCNAAFEKRLDALAEAQERRQTEAQTKLAVTLEELEKRVLASLPAPRAEVVEEAKKKEIFEDLF